MSVFIAAPISAIASVIPYYSTSPNLLALFFTWGVFVLTKAVFRRLLFRRADAANAQREGSQN